MNDKIKHAIRPDYTSIHPWENYAADLMVEYQQSIEEGLDVEIYRSLFEAASAMPEGEAKQQIADALFSIVQNAQIRADYAYDEPSALDEIKALRPDARPGNGTVCDDILKDKLIGAWYGRICGCLAGKPVEGMRTRDLVPMLKAS